MRRLALLLCIVLSACAKPDLAKTPPAPDPTRPAQVQNASASPATMPAQAGPAPNTPAAPNYPAPVEGDYLIKDFHFRSGETLPELRIHYRTIGEPKRDAKGEVRNAVLIGHGTGGAGTQFLGPQFANVLFGPGGALDANKYFIVLADGIGHGGSSKPSDGMHARFPHYTYDDMVAAQYELLTKKLGVNHLRLVMGTSMGGMHTWVWGETYPDFMDALMPLASLPVEIAGRNRIWRRMAMDAIRDDPEWLGGEYKTQPLHGLIAAENILLVVGSAPLYWQKQYPTRDAADAFYAQRVKDAVAKLDANDLLYQLGSSREYNPVPKLDTIKASLLAVNSADDQINPPELGLMEREIKKVKHGRFVLLPITDQTRGHGTHTLPLIWQDYLRELLAETER
ncbi:MAG: alpha/beta fold hydrolase [Planctomycetes bacterium]|nr:alpha/beta fold hydrolase [Planctomycetota bacterium]